MAMLWIQGSGLSANAQPLAQDLQVKVTGIGQIRYQNTQIESLDSDVNRLSAAIRLAVEVTLSPRFTILVEGESNFALFDRFDPDPTVFAPLPNIDDPDTLGLNRAQLLTSLDDQTYLTLGRHRLAVDDQRFLGRAAFRLNEQSFDGAHFFKRTANGTTFQAGYFGQVNRALGSDNPFGRFKGDSYYANLNVPTPIGRVGVFHYALDLETGPEEALTNHFSTRTSGVRYDGRWHADEIGLDVEASYARQIDFADHPFDFALDYWLIGGRAFLGPLRLGARAESLGTGGGESFQSPAGSLHQFQGDADIFVVNPKQGLFDQEVSIIWIVGRIGELSGVSVTANHHWFESDIGNIDYGTELDIRLNANWNALNFGLVYADYNADEFSEDTRRIFFSISKRF